MALLSTLVGSTSAGPAGTETYVNCQSTDPVSDGTSAHPFKTLDEVNTGRVFGAGDKLLFIAGTTCDGQLKPTGSGAPGSPWTITNSPANGALARINGNGAASAVLIRNAQHVEISNLELTNESSTVAARRGLHVVLDNFGTGTHYRVSNLFVHNVSGDDPGGTAGSDGILFSVVGTQVRGHFDDVQVTGNWVLNVSHEAIEIGPSDWRHRAEAGSTPAQIAATPWTPQTNVIVSQNTVTNAGTSGIMVHHTAGAVVEQNTVNGFASHPTAKPAGIWTTNSDDTTIQFNTVTGGQRANDGEAFDADLGTVRTKIQYNFSGNNLGGFVLLCAQPSTVTKDAVVRYNVSQNDGGPTTVTGNPLAVNYNLGVGLCGGSTQNAQVYKNAIYAGAGRSMALFNEGPGTLHDVKFRKQHRGEGGRRGCLGVAQASQRGATLRQHPEERGRSARWIQHPDRRSSVHRARDGDRTHLGDRIPGPPDVSCDRSWAIDRPERRTRHVRQPGARVGPGEHRRIPGTRNDRIRSSSSRPGRWEPRDQRDLRDRNGHSVGYLLVDGDVRHRTSEHLRGTPQCV
jgi:hypothetical protein